MLYMRSWLEDEFYIQFNNTLKDDTETHLTTQKMLNVYVNMH